MPSKWPFCRRKYIRSGAYEKHLRTVHSNLDIVLASTLGYASSGDITNDVETSILHHPEARERLDSDYESDPDPTGQELDAFAAHQSDTEIPDDSTSCHPADRSIIPAPVKQLETSTDLSKKTAISARICAHRSVFCSVSNWRLGSFRVKYLNQESMNTSRVASVFLR